MRFTKITHIVVLVIFLFGFFSIREGRACSDLPSGPVTAADLNGVGVGNYASHGFPNNSYGVTDGFCSVNTTNNSGNPYQPSGCIKPCAGGHCTLPFQQAQCGAAPSVGCNDTTPASATAPIDCEYSCTPNVTAPLLSCHKRIYSGSCGGGNSVCTGCHAASLDFCSVVTTPTVTVSSSPIPAPTCVFSPWDQHRCAKTGFTSSMPSPSYAGMAGDFDKVMNSMASCCWNGWAQSGKDWTWKLDCIERVVQPGEDFLKFYYEGGPRGTPPSNSIDDEKFAGVTYPNQLFMLNSMGTIPINGFYNAKGERCSYSTGPKTPDQQMDLFDAALDAGAPPASVLPNCCNLVLLALERKCPASNPVSSPQVYWRTSYTSGSTPVTRCTAASEMRVHYALFDLCNPATKKRARFHGVTSIGGLSNTDNLPSTPIELDALIKKAFPTQAPGTCPTHFHMSGGKCVID